MTDRIVYSGNGGDRNRSQITCTGGRTKQSFKDECDINQILKKWRRTGELEHLSTHKPTYGDFSNPDDYITALTKVKSAQADFDALSSRIRARMDNDPAAFLSFMEDPENHDEAVALGLISKPATPAPVPVAPVPPESPPEPESGSTPVSGGD